MKKILSHLFVVIAALLALAGSALADTCASSLTGPAFTPAQAVKLCSTFGSSLSISLLPQTTNAVDLGSASKQWRNAYLGTNLVFGAANAKIIPGATSLKFQNNADTNTNLQIADAGTATFRASILPATDGDNTLSNLGSGSFGFKNIYLSDAINRSQFVQSSGLYVSYPSGQGLFFRNASTDVWSLTSAGVLTQNATNGGDIVMAKAASGLVTGETARAANVTTATTAAAPVYVSGAAASGDLAAFVGSGAAANGATVDFFKTRATSGQASTIVQSGDTIGQLKFYGANGTTYDPAAVILVTVDTTPGATTDMPGAIDFQLSPDASATPASVLKLKNDKSANFTGAIKSTATSLGWVVRSGANTACTTTCTAGKGCAFGYDIGTTSLVDCASALADSCVCTQ